ncbi:DUF4386 domain-containing protein [Membranihabitans marinus]|uniref:DUF4386 domain-containing protein n=1 Tax=Membranihabitans marinus TaxID=1227546 RepID=UPI001F46F461|nr:DUF4386 domain-containing protein [Membranihabitans marinus]
MKKQHNFFRLAGILYFIVIICGIFAELFVRGSIFQADDAVSTYQNIVDSNRIYLYGFISDLIMQTAYLLLPMVLFMLFKHIDQYIASTMIFFVMIAVAIMCINMLNHYAPIILIEQGQLVKGNDVISLQNQIVFYLTMHEKGYHIAQIFFGLWLMPLGYLVYRSKNFPKFLGICLMLGCLGYLIDFAIYFLSPNLNQILTSWITLPADIGEVGLCLYLLFQSKSRAN